MRQSVDAFPPALLLGSQVQIGQNLTRRARAPLCDEGGEKVHQLSRFLEVDGCDWQRVTTLQRFLSFLISMWFAFYVIIGHCYPEVIHY